MIQCSRWYLNEEVLLNLKLKLKREQQSVCVCVYMQIDVWNNVITARWWSALSLSLYSKSVKVFPRGWHGTSNRRKVPQESMDTSAPPEGSFLFASREVKCWVLCDHTGPVFRACPWQAAQPKGKTNGSASYLWQTVETVLCRKVSWLPLPDVTCLFARLTDTLWSDQTTTRCLTSWTYFRVDYFTYL